MRPRRFAIRVRAAQLRAAIPVLTGIGYLLAAIVPCPPDPTRISASAAHQHTVESDGSTSVTAPCLCGCDKAPGAGETGKRLGPALLPDAAALLARGAPLAVGAAVIWPRELPDRIDPPIPIAA